METSEFTKYRNPVEYAKIIFRRKWLFITPIFIGIVLAIVASFILPPTYESYTVIMVEEEKTLNPLIQGLAVSTNIAQRMSSIKENLLSWSRLVELTKKLNLADNVNTQADFEKFILGLRSDIKVRLYGPSLIRISYYGDQPQKTHLIAQTLADLLIEENIRTQTKESDVAIEFIKEQLNVYKRKIKESEIAQMQERLQELLVDSTEQHPMVRDIRTKIAAAQREMETGEFEVPVNERPIVTPAYEALQKEIDKMIHDEAQDTLGSAAYASETDEPRDPNEKIVQLMLMDKLDSVMARDMHVNENIYNMLLQKLETAKISQRLEVSKQGTRYTIIDPPRLPLKPIKPNKLQLMFFGLFLGGFSGIGLVFGKEFLDHSFMDIDEAREILDQPVLGAISRLTTQEEIDREKHGSRKRIAIALSLAAALIIVVFLISIIKK